MDKGEYKILLQIRHESIKQLEHVQELPIQIIHKLRDTITLPIYSSNYQAIIGNDSKKLTNILLPTNITVPIFISNIMNGSCLIGSKSIPIKSSMMGIFRGNISIQSNQNSSNNNNDQQQALFMKNFPIELIVDCDGSNSISNQNNNKNKQSTTPTTTTTTDSTTTTTDSTKSSSSTSNDDKDLNEIRIGLVNKLDKNCQRKYLESLESDTNVACDPQFLLAKLQLRYQEPIKNPHSKIICETDEASKTTKDDKHDNDIVGGGDDHEWLCSKEKELLNQIEMADKILEPIIKDFLNTYTTLKLDTKRILVSQSQAKM